MEQSILNYLSGYVRIRISGKYVERFLSLCAFHDIRIWNLISHGTYYEGNMRRKDYLRLRPVVRKSRVSIRMIKKYGILFWLNRHKKRKMFLVGIFAAACMLWYLSAHIWNIKIEGNYSCSDEQVLEYLYSSDIRHGIRKTEFDCRNLAGQIRNHFPVFSWVSVEMKGTVLIIHVKENQVTDGSTEEEDKRNSNTASSLYAASDGTIYSIYIRNGISHVSAGDEVKKGALLVSGVLPVYNDAGEISSLQYAKADADIVIQRKIKYSDTVYFRNTGRLFSNREKNRYILKIGNLAFGFPYGNLRQKENYTILQKIRQMKLFDSFYFPIYLEKLTVKEYKEIDIIYTKEKCEELLQADFEYFMKNLKEKGVQIFENDVKIEWNEKSAILSGNVTVGEIQLERRLVADIEEEIQKNEYG